MTPPDQLPAIIPPGALTTPTDTYIVPALVADAGDAAGWRYVEFFTANIENSHARRAYARACGRFFVWCERRGLTLATIRPFNVAAWVKELREEHSTPGVKQQLAAVRMLFDWLITGQVLPTNPAASVRGPKYVVATGKTPVLASAPTGTPLTRSLTSYARPAARRFAAKRWRARGPTDVDCSRCSWPLPPETATWPILSHSGMWPASAKFPTSTRE